MDVEDAETEVTGCATERGGGSPSAQSSRRPPPKARETAKADGSVADADAVEVAAAMVSRRGSTRDRPQNRTSPARLSPRKIRQGDDSIDADEQAIAVATGTGTRARREFAAASHADGGNEKRRRRRRRGRRGRRHEGDTTMARNARRCSTANFKPRPPNTPRTNRATSAYPTQVEPNTPSSPQWSLSEHRGRDACRRARSGTRTSDRPDDFARSNVSGRSGQKRSRPPSPNRMSLARRARAGGNAASKSEPQWNGMKQTP